MAYNYGPPPGSYRPGQPPYPFPGAGGPPGMGPPPGMEAAPGVQSQSPTTMQNPSFQPPPNMPNINFNAPVIRLGVQDQQSGRGGFGGAADRLTGGQGGNRAEGRGSNAEPLGRNSRMGVGAGQGNDNRNIERERAAVRENMMAMQPPTREEVARTIFIGGLGAHAPDDVEIEGLLRCAGKLRRWTRAKDADDAPCKFGFAEYEDVESLEAANEILPGLEVPLMQNGVAMKDDEGSTKMATLLVVVDEQSKDYIEEWKGKRREDDDTRQFRIDGCKEDLRQTLTALANTGVSTSNGEQLGRTGGDTTMTDAAAVNGDGAAVVTIPLDLEDELSDIPTEMRATIVEEIRAFRDRSNRRDVERLKREEELEQLERQRSTISNRVSRLASPPANTPSGPASAANGIPVGPRDKAGILNAPSGPRGYRGAQLPSDYVNGVAFVGSNGALTVNEDEDASESDKELERRRHAKKDAEIQEQYKEASRRWMNRERTRGNALERERTREEALKKEEDRAREKEKRRLREFNEDKEARTNELDYYRDRSNWLRKRVNEREREEREDERDRQAENREKSDERRKEAEARGMADDFLEQTGLELEQRAAEQASKAAAPGGAVKISLGSAAARTRAAAAATTQSAPRRAMADVENLLEDEDEDTVGMRARPELKPLTDTSTTPLPDAGSELTDEERASARQALAATIPNTTAELFAYPVRWNYLTSELLDSQIQPFIERKIVEYLGVQEDLLVEAVLEGLRAHKSAAEIVAEVEPALEEDAEGLLRKCWRVLVFATESEARGLN